MEATSDRSVDHVISNGVINLAPRKRVLAECARVLVPGGKLSVSDLTVGDEELHPRSSPTGHVGRLRVGALTERDFVEKLEQEGFGEIEIHQREPVSRRRPVALSALHPRVNRADATSSRPSRRRRSQRRSS